VGDLQQVLDAPGLDQRLYLLRLHVVQRAVSSLGGELQLESGPGQLVTCTVSLPTPKG
jgi:hypothetical protein